MAAAGLPLAATFVLLWAPPQPGTSLWNLVYLAVILMLYRIASSFYQVPYQALLPELASTDQQRVQLSAWQSGFLLVGFMLGGLSGPLIEHWGYLPTATLYAAVALFALYLPLLFLRESRLQPVAATRQDSFWQGFLVTIRNRAFLVFAIAWAFYLMTSTLAQSAAAYIVTEICALSEADTIYFYVPAVLASLVCYPLVTWLSRRYGKWKVYAGSLFASVIVFPGTLLMGPWLPIPLKVQCSSWAMLQAAAISGAVVLSAPFIAEITDYDEVQTGQRREGMYFAAMKVLDQVFSGISLVLLSVLFLLGRSGTDTNGPLGVRMVGLVSGVFMLVGLLFFVQYPVRDRSPGQKR